jgi:hypothetical protein
MERHMTCDFDFHRDHRWAIYDRYGIFFTYVCPKCEHTKISQEQRQHLESYEPDEPIEDY